MASRILAERYRLQDLLSTTTMAEVRAATDLVLERPVVVKLLAPEAERSRFEREAQAVAVLAHPNIVQLFDYGEEEGRPYMVFEYLPGGSLEQRLDAALRLPDEDTARIAAEIAAGLAHAHTHGVVHRDMKPGNVLFDVEGRAKIADFGIARIGGVDTITKAGMVLGTAAYISPEQARGEPATPASDVYSVGVMLYRMLSGRLPFEAKSPIELAAMHRDADPPPIASIRPDVPASLATLAMSALAKGPEGRPPDGAALLAALDLGHAERIESEAETQVLSSRPQSRLSPKRVIAGGSLAALILAGFLGAVLLTNRPASAPAVPNGDSPSHSTRPDSSIGVTSPTGVTSRESSSPTTSSQTATPATATTDSHSTVASTTSISSTLPTTSESTSETTAPVSTAPLPTSTATS